MITKALWQTKDYSHYVELVTENGRYLLRTTLGLRYLDAHDFDNDANAIEYVDRRVKDGFFDPPPLTWERKH